MNILFTTLTFLSTRRKQKNQRSQEDNKINEEILYFQNTITPINCTSEELTIGVNLSKGAPVTL